MPTFDINFTSIFIAVIASFFFGFIWYTFLFKKTWATEMGFDPDGQPAKPEMLKGMSLAILGNFFLAWVFSHNIAVWNPETWGLPPSDYSAFARALMAAFFTWLGFIVPLLLNSVAWEKKSWKLFAINAAYHFIALLMVAVILIFL